MWLLRVYINTHVRRQINIMEEVAIKPLVGVGGWNFKVSGVHVGTDWLIWHPAPRVCLHLWHIMSCTSGWRMPWTNEECSCRGACHNETRYYRLVGRLPTLFGSTEAAGKGWEALGDKPSICCCLHGYPFTEIKLTQEAFLATVIRNVTPIDNSRAKPWLRGPQSTLPVYRAIPMQTLATNYTWQQ